MRPPLEDPTPPSSSPSSPSFLSRFRATSGDLDRIGVAWDFLQRGSGRPDLRSRIDWRIFHALVAAAPALVAGWVLHGHYWERRTALGVREESRYG
jgi:hypothetical protein